MEKYRSFKALNAFMPAESYDKLMRLKGSMSWPEFIADIELKPPPAPLSWHDRRLAIVEAEIERRHLVNYCERCAYGRSPDIVMLQRVDFNEYFSNLLKIPIDEVRRKFKEAREPVVQRVCPNHKGDKVREIFDRVWPEMIGNSTIAEYELRDRLQDCQNAPPSMQ